MTLKPLGKVKGLIESAGMGISHVYEDLIFMEHNAFLLQFGHDETSIIIHINDEAHKEELTESIGQLENAALQNKMKIIPGELYSLCPSDDDSIIVEFHE